MSFSSADDDSRMNGYQAPPLAPSSSHINGHDTEAKKHMSAAKGLDESEEIYFLRSSSKHKKKSHKQRKHVTKNSVNSLTDTSQYHVEHLTTFVLDRKDGMITVEDGIRRLRLLDAKGKVWTQEILLQVEEKSVSLLDQETNKELEKFPVGSIQHCQAVMKSCSYDSILALVCKESGQSKPDLHLFQCDHIKANLIHADVESAMMDAKGGKVKKRPETLKMILKSDGLIPPPPLAPAPEPPPPSDTVDVKSRVAAWSAWTSEQQDYEIPQSLWDDYGSVEVTAAKVDRDVQILNHILDDIEFFIARLRKSAEAFGELSSRKKAKKGKKKSPGEGVLTLRSKPPSEDEFVDCLQKFKHAFNQLAKLKGQIQNPSAMDLVHFLFAPLKMVIQASSSPDLARSVVVPLLTRDAIELLHEAGTAEERHLWVALGDGWTKCRLEWPKDQYFPPCALKFRDGWEPPALPTPARERHLAQLAESLTSVGIQRQDEPSAGPTQEGAPQMFPSSDGYDFSNSVKHRQFLDQDTAVAAFKHVLSRRVDRGFDSVGTKLFAKSKYDFVARNGTELSVLRDELVEVLDDRKQWWKVCNGDGVTGYVPNNILQVTRAVDVTGRAEPVYSHTIQRLLGELNEKQTSRTDLVQTTTSPSPPTPPLPPPSTQAAKPAAAATDNSAISRQNSSASSDRGSATMRDHRDQTPATSGRRKSNMEEVQDELLHRLTLGRSAQKKFQVSPRGSPSLNITYDSSPWEVKAWLEAKGFSPVTISSLGVLTGAQLFSLKKEELKTVCPDDGARVYSQVMVQKAALEKSSGSELQEIMRRRQEKLAASTCDSGVESFDEGSAH